MREDGLSVPTWLGTAFDIPGLIDLGALEDALRTWTLRHEPLRSGFREDGDAPRRFTLDAGSVCLHRETGSTRVMKSWAADGSSSVGATACCPASPSTSA